MRSRLASCLVATVAVLAAPATAAWAHEEISPATFPTGKPAFLTLNAANEESSNLTTVTLTPPQGITFGEATQPPPGWTADASPGTITWTGGSLPPQSIGSWGFEINPAPQPGPLRFSVDLGFADGSSHDSQVEVTAAAPSTETTVAPATTAGEAVTTVTPAALDAETNDSMDTAALVVGIIAAVLALVAIALAARHRHPAAASGGPAAGDSTKKDQDW